MTDPTEIEIEPGKPQEVISDVDVGSVPYIVEVKNAPVRFAHRKRQADRGAELSAGQTHTLSNFRGSGIWLSAPEETARVRVRPAGANLETQPSKDVTVLDTVEVENLGVSYSGFQTDIVTGDGTPDSVSVPSGVGVVFRSAPDNNDIIQVSDFPLDVGEAVTLAVNDPSNVSITMNDQDDRAVIIHEVNE